MTKVFESTWVNEIKKRYYKRPSFQQPALYRVAVLPEWEKTRNQIEDIVLCLTMQQQIEVTQRIRNPDLFSSTYNELIAGRILKNCGHSIEYEKLVGNKTPDWYVYPKEDFGEFIVEVATIMPPKQIQEETYAWNELRYRIRKIEHHYHLFISTHTPGSLIGKDMKLIVSFLQSWFSTFDLINPPEKKEITYQDQDLKITFRILRKTTIPKPVEFVGPFFTQWVNPELLRNTISKKLTKYKEAKEAHLPLVIALFPTFYSALSIDSLMDVLYGKEQVSIPDGTVSRDRSGMILPRLQNGQTMLLNTRLSVLLFVEQSTQAEIRIIHNPYAQDPISPDLFKGFQQFVIKNRSDTYFEMDWESF